MKNLFAAAYAPMYKDGSLNLSLIRDYSNFLWENHIKGVFVNGSTGDFVSLSTPERNKLLHQWAKDRPKDLYLINHVGHNNLKEAQEMAEFSIGKADAVAAIAPFYFVTGKMEDLLQYCAAIAQSAGNLPFYYYHLPALTGVQFSMKEFSRLAKQRIPNFAGIKFTENNIVEFQKLNLDQKNLDIFFGVDEAFLSSLSTGAKGWVGSTYNQMAPLYISIKKSFDSNNISEANRLQGLGIDFVETLAAMGGFNGAGKSFMQMLGIDCGPSRFPHVSLNRDQLLKTQAYFDSIELTQYLCK